MGASGQYRSRMRQMRSSESFFLSDADAVSGRTNVDVLPVRRLRLSVERKLKRANLVKSVSFFVVAALSFCSEDVHAQDYLDSVGVPDRSEVRTFVLFACIHERLALTRLVLRHYARMRDEFLVSNNIKLLLFVTGSDPVSTQGIADEVNAAFSIYPNSPLGAKHNAGLRAIRSWCTPMHQDAAQDASVMGRRVHCDGPVNGVIVIGSDDILNGRYFLEIRSRLEDNNANISLDAVGVRDLHIYDLATDRLAYTRGYRKRSAGMSSTIGCGRVFTWSLLERMRWELWDDEKDRGLDQSCVRRIESYLGTAAFRNCVAIMGRSNGIVVVDIKSAGLDGGRNIWNFDDIVSAVGSKGPLHRFRFVQAESFFSKEFGDQFAAELAALRQEMMQQSPDSATAFEPKSNRDVTACDLVDVNVCAVRNGFHDQSC